MTHLQENLLNILEYEIENSLNKINDNPIYSRIKKIENSELLVEGSKYWITNNQFLKHKYKTKIWIEPTLRSVRVLVEIEDMDTRENLTEFKKEILTDDNLFSEKNLTECKLQLSLFFLNNKNYIIQ